MRKMQTYNVSEELNRTFGAPGRRAEKKRRIRLGKNIMPKFFWMLARVQVLLNRNLPRK